MSRTGQISVRNCLGEITPMSTMYLVALLLVIPSYIDGRSPGVKPNILVIMADDLGWNDVGFHSSEILTPNIDQLAAKGIELDNYYVSPRCGPTRAQFLSGQYLTRMGLQHKNFEPCRPMGLPTHIRTLADDLQNAGYDTHHIGKWHAGFYTENHLAVNRGFTTSRGILNGLGDHYQHTKGYSGTPYLDMTDQNQPYPDGVGNYSTNFFTDRAKDIIQGYTSNDKPFFLWLSYTAPHSPLQAPEEYISLYGHIPDQKRKIFAAMVTAMDAAIGEVVAELENNGMMENTVIIFTSDNGGQSKVGASNYPFRGNKSYFYEGGVKAVGLVSSPLLAQRQGTSCTELVYVTDWKPTFLALAGMANGENFDGFNQWPSISQGTTSPRKEIIFNIDPLTGTGNRGKHFDTSQLAAIRVGDWKLLTGDHRFNGIVPNPATDINGYKQMDYSVSSKEDVQLYNIRADPTESNNVAGSNRKLVKDLLAKLQNHEQTAATPLWPDVTSDCNPALRGGTWGPYRLVE